MLPDQSKVFNARQIQILTDRVAVAGDNQKLAGKGHHGTTTWITKKGQPQYSLVPQWIARHVGQDAGHRLRWYLRKNGT